MKFLFKQRYSPFHFIVFLFIVFAIMVVSAKYIGSQLRGIAFQSPLPDIVVAERAAKGMPEVYLREYEFTVDGFTQNIPVWKKVLEQFKSKPNINYLEIGIFEGRSMFWMLENILTNSTAKVTGIDVFLREDIKKTYYANLELSGLSDKVTTIEDYSQLAMRKLPLESFDIVYIDGSHVMNDVLEDAVLSWRLVKKGGILIFDDYCHLAYSSHRSEFPKPAIDAFVQFFDKHFEVIHNDYQLILRRIK